MKQTARIISSLLLMSLIIQLFSGIFGVTPVEARSLRLFNQNYNSSFSNSAHNLSSSQALPDEEETDSESGTQPGPPEPPESFPELPEESIPGSEEPLDGGLESTQPVESSSQEQASQPSNESSSSSGNTPSSASNQPPVQQDETVSDKTLMQIAPGSLMIKPANSLEPINIASTVKHLASDYYDLILVSIKSGIILTQQLMFPSGALVSQKIASHLIGYFESLLNLIVQA